jgi:DNA-binding XRE family transcriptional regulator
MRWRYGYAASFKRLVAQTRARDHDLVRCCLRELDVTMTPEQCRMARGALGWSQIDLAAKANVARKTVADFELKKINPYARTLRDFVETFEAAGVIFLPADSAAGPGVRLKLGCV